MPQFGSSNRTTLRMVPEVTLGVTPGNPALELIRYTGESLSYDIKSTQSSEIRPDSVETDLIPTSVDVSGDISYELSFQTIDKFLEAALRSTFGAPVSGVSSIKNGTARKSFTIQKGFNDLQTVTYQNFVGTMVNTLSIDVPMGAIVTGSIGLMGISASMTETQFAGATLTASSGAASRPMTGMTGFTQFKENGVSSTAAVRKVSIAIANNIRAQDALGQLEHVGLVHGRLEITGTVEMYFQRAADYQAFEQMQRKGLSFRLVDTAGNYYEFIMPNVAYESGKVVSGNADQDLLLQYNIRALFDNTAACVIEVKKYAA